MDWIDWMLLAMIGVLSAGLLATAAWPLVAKWMNRPRPGVQVVSRYETAGETRGVPIAVDYLLYLPEEYNRDRRLWPLVLFLHGAGERGTDVMEVAVGGPPWLVAEGGELPVILVSPQCAPKQRWQPEILLELIDEVTARHRVDTQRICVTGYSMGGFGTWALAAAVADRFAAAAPLCGGGDPESAARLGDLPVWVFHGDADQVVPLESSKKMVEAVQAVGGNVKFTVYPGEGHGICGKTYASGEFWRWLLAQRREDAGTSEEMSGL